MWRSDTSQPRNFYMWGSTSWKGPSGDSEWLGEARQPVTFWFESSEGDFFFFFGGGGGSLPVGWLLLLLPFGFIQICLFVEVRPAVGSSAGKAAAFNCSLLWSMGEKEASWLVLHNSAFFILFYFFLANAHAHGGAHTWMRASMWRIIEHTRPNVLLQLLT